MSSMILLTMLTRPTSKDFDFRKVGSMPGAKDDSMPKLIRLVGLWGRSADFGGLLILH